MRPLFILTLTLLLAACSTQPISRSTYLLRSDHGLETRALQTSADLYLGEVIIAGYIDQPGLVLEGASNTIHTAKYHQWAEPLRTSLRQFLNTEISAGLGADIAISRISQEHTRRLDVKIDQLHGDMDGNAVLVAYWSLTQDGKTAEYQYVRSLPLQEPGYEALVAAEKRLLIDMAQTIANDLK
ncbi:MULTISPECIES: membrane integrity-associated transporter subunit PqiC [unclassified Lentimonas]|uniref:PqiC family protein n=1 Tax=unclassified Lentimonas TaxID=2630993 RepID=UPI001323FB16|nr:MULTISPECIES: PqiC family protein [unclassified Lentimonas]CAA6692304.1 Unannotated [Lentimonas sp. CC19]CAA6696404.1 Unannotated [Lentimonas sp. CC10]CAA7069106.1 Unannotated [Lentimonas sp. CC11]